MSEDSNKKAIIIDPKALNYGGTASKSSSYSSTQRRKDEKKKKDMLLNVNPKNVKELLLKKLKGLS